MDKGKTDSKVLLVGAIVTVLILVALFIKKVNKPDIEPRYPDQTESTTQTDQQVVSEPEPAIEEGLYLEVTNPVDGSSVSNPTLGLSGKTEANAEVFINESELTADSAGNFSTTITLDEGENIIVVTASDNEGNYAEKSITVTYEPVN